MKRYMLWNAVVFFWLCCSAAPGDGYLLSEMCTKEEKGEKLSVPNVKFFEENLCYMWKFTVSCSPCCGEKELFFGGWAGGFDVVVFPKWRICCFWFSHVVHRVIREIICRCSRIILALSSLVRFFFLGYVFSPLRACLTISKCRSSKQALIPPFDISLNNIPSLQEKQHFVVSLLHFSLFFYCFICEPAGGSASEDCTVLIHKLLHACHSNELCCLAFITAQIVFPLWRLPSGRETKRWRLTSEAAARSGTHTKKLCVISLKIARVIMTSAS